jgi:hypothetical protein
MDRWLYITLLLAALIGCGKSPAPDPATHRGRMALAALPGLRATAHSGLQAELTLVEQDRGLPLQLAAAETGSTGTGNKPTSVGLLQRAFPPLSRGLVRGPLDAVYRGGPLRLSPVQLERSRELVRKHATAMGDFRAALPQQPGGFGSRLCDGTLADLSFLEPLDLGCRLEAVAAAVVLSDDSPEGALPHLGRLLTTARVLAAEPNVTTRIAAANLRADALHLLAEIVSHEQCTTELHQRLFDLLGEQVAGWPADSQAWIGDRAAGMLTYELVREGHYLSLLAADEVRELQAKQTLHATAQAAIRGIDDDEQFYLQAMRQLIDASRQPYSERQEVLASIRRSLQDKEQTADYPLVAGKLLLADFETAQQRQVEDLARCQAWMLALGTALGHESPAAVTNPRTGSPFKIERTPLAVTVAAVLPGRDEPCVVPLPSPRQARR